MYDTKYRDIPELENVSALAAVTPEKDIYHIGDTIMFSVMAEKEKEHNWYGFERASFISHFLTDILYSDEKIAGLIYLNHYPHRANLNNGKWIVQHKEFYKLEKEGIYIFDINAEERSTNLYPVTNKIQVTYTEGNTVYSADIPVYFKDGKKSIEITVEEQWLVLPAFP